MEAPASALAAEAASLERHPVEAMYLVAQEMDVVGCMVDVFGGLWLVMVEAASLAAGEVQAAWLEQHPALAAHLVEAAACLLQHPVLAVSLVVLHPMERARLVAEEAVCLVQQPVEEACLVGPR